MSLTNEVDIYDKASVSLETGEIKEFDDVVFPKVIRKREIDLIFSKVLSVKLKRILDFGCGAGWLSKILASNRQNVVGVDVNRRLIKYAKKASRDSEFIVADCMHLPFKNGCFDAVIGMAILHHLDTFTALAECQRVTIKKAMLIFMEPNRLNPISGLGRKLLPMETCTIGEKPFTLFEVAEMFAKARLFIKELTFLFPFSFGLARLFRRYKLPDTIAPLITTIEGLLEKTPYIKSLGSTFFIVAIKT